MYRTLIVVYTTFYIKYNDEVSHKYYFQEKNNIKNINK